MFPTAPSLTDLRIAPDSFQGRRRTVNRQRTIPGQLRLLRETGQIAGLTPAFTGMRHRGRMTPTFVDNHGTLGTAEEIPGAKSNP